MFHGCGLVEVQLLIMGRERGESKIYKLTRIESALYRSLKWVDNLLLRIVPGWGFFLFVYGVRK